MTQGYVAIAPLETHVPVLDHGYVRLVDWMGSDLTPVNAAKVSFEKESREFGEKEARLTAFLAEHGHTSPFRHPKVQLSIRAPLMVARQWYKYVVGAEGGDQDFAWNEASRRYVTEHTEFYTPETWRSAPVSKKQGSGGALPEGLAWVLRERLARHQAEGKRLYEMAMEEGACAEQARLFLPAYGLYVSWHWTASLQAVCHFLNQRLADDAQAEIRAYAVAVRALVQPLFPVATSHLLRAPAGEGGR